MSHKSFQVTLASVLATAGTLTVSYPTGTSRTTFLHGVQHQLIALGAKYVSPTSITVALNAASAVITYNGTTTIPAGTVVTVMLDAGGEVPTYVQNALDAGVKGGRVVRVDLGNPATADADGYIVSASLSSGVAVTTMTGALAVSGVGTPDVPRNVVAAWTNTAILTVTGTDAYGATVVESSASGTSMAGLKAFKTVTSVVFNANVTSCTIGTGDVLGLPVFCPGTASLLKESQDLSTPTAGTLVGGLSAGTKSTATTADVRGTYDPNAACDGSKAFSLILFLEDPTWRGNPQYAG